MFRKLFGKIIILALIETSFVYGKNKTSILNCPVVQIKICSKIQWNICLFKFHTPPF